MLAIDTKSNGGLNHTPFVIVKRRNADRFVIGFLMNGQKKVIRLKSVNTMTPHRIGCDIIRFISPKGVDLLNSLEESFDASPPAKKIALALH